MSAEPPENISGGFVFVKVYLMSNNQTVATVC
jgi:hypothetical protein